MLKPRELSTSLSRKDLLPSDTPRPWNISEQNKSSLLPLLPRLISMLPSRREKLNSQLPRLLMPLLLEFTKPPRPIDLPRLDSSPLLKLNTLKPKLKELKPPRLVNTSMD